MNKQTKKYMYNLHFYKMSYKKQKKKLISAGNLKNFISICITMKMSLMSKKELKNFRDNKRMGPKNLKNLKVKIKNFLNQLQMF